MLIEACAKLNLTLEVFGKRPDGYHALRSVVMPVSLSDTLEIVRTDDGSVTSDTGYEDDLIVRAARLLGVGAAVHVTKRIPAGGGLGGGSADAAATLVALNGMYSLGKSREELAELGARLGSDVPSLVHGRPVVMEGRGEIVTPIPFEIPTLHLVLANPGVHSSTAEVYRACEPRAEGGDDATGRMLEALKSGELGRIAASFANDLEAPAVRLHPEIGAALAALRGAGVIGAAMSGSGASVFGLVDSETAAARISSELSGKGLPARPILTRITNL